MSWSGRRQFFYSLGFLIFALGILFFALSPIIFREPSCTDGKQNGSELGVDCGGSCQKYCPAQIADPIILWSRSFPVSGSVYNLIAYIENQNVGAAVYDVAYEFRVYDKEGKFIGRREGRTFIPPNQRFAIFEPHFDVGASIPQKVTFEFMGQIVWLKKDPITSKLPIRIDRINYSTSSGSPRLSARVRNDSIFQSPAFDVFAILYDSTKNAIGASKTHLDGVARNGSMPVVFTWPKNFEEEPTTKDIFPVINPFAVKF